MKNPAAQQLGRLGGMAKSAAKTKAARENGKLGGRPKNKKRAARRGETPNIEHPTSNIQRKAMTPSRKKKDQI